MAPKFRGDGDDWLDDSDSDGSGSKAGSGRRAKIAARKPPSRAAALDPAEANATVAEVYPKLCLARLDENGREILCSYRRATVFGQEGLHSVRERSPVAVGDRVKISLSGPPASARDGVVEGVCARRNFLARPAPGKEGSDLVHVIAANVDILVIVASAGKPEFTPGLVDRFLVAAQAAGIPPLVCVNKLDMLEAGATRPWSLYRELGIEVFEASARADEGVAELKRRIEGSEAVFCGQSGVGKTSLIRALTGVDVGRVADVSDATGKGKHTTTGARLLDVPGASKATRWIDTPGVREFGLHGVTPEDLQRFFPELGCSCATCDHADCEASRKPRWSSYSRILESLKAGEH